MRRVLTLAGLLLSTSMITSAWTIGGNEMNGTSYLHFESMQLENKRQSNQNVNSYDAHRRANEKLNTTKQYEPKMDVVPHIFQNRRPGGKKSYETEAGHTSAAIETLSNVIGGNERNENDESQWSNIAREAEKLHVWHDYSENSETEDINVCKTSEDYNVGSQSKVVFSEDRRDMFKCGRCMCKYLNNPTHVAADCVKKKLTSVPDDMPNNVVEFDISQNRIVNFNLWTIFSYKILKELHATDCYIQNLTNSLTGLSSPLEVLDLRYNYIQTLLPSIFYGFKNLQTLLLTGNMITHLQEDFFIGLENLHFLDLSINNLLSIDALSFHGLTHLQKLTLSGNSNLGYRNLTYEVFKNLKRLKKLSIQGCSNGAKEYPNEAIGALQNLEDLNIDALAYPAEFQSQFATLKHLKVLRFGPYADCRLEKMPESFFQYVPNISCLYFHSCNTSINHNAYGSFTKLKALIMEKVPGLNIDQAFSNLTGFKTKSLTHIGFKNLTHWYWPCIWLDEKEGKYMTGFNLTSIDLSENRLSLLVDNFIKAIPKTVEKLILRGNKFTLINTLWTTLANLTKLNYIDVSSQNSESQSHYFPLDFESKSTKSTNRFKEEKASSAAIASFASKYLQKPFTLSDTRTAKQESSGVLRIPENLQTVKASNYHLFGDVLLSQSVGNNSLAYLNFSESGLHQWGRGRVPKYVKSLDLSLNAATYINPDFFHPNNSLEELHLNVNFLGEYIYKSNSSTFRHLKNLRSLDLSTNVIFEIPFDFFDGLKKIEDIVLTNNRLETLNVSFENTKNLKFLDLHGNSLSWISATTRNQLDGLKHVTVDLHYNSFVCDCDTIDIIQWMSVTRVYLLNMHLYTCKDQKNQLVGMRSREEMKQRVNYLKRACFSSGYLIFGTTAFALIFIISTTVGIVYRNRWWIRYKKHTLFAKWFGFKPQNGGNNSEGQDFKYDAFLLYINADRRFALRCSKELEMKRHHKLFIEDRDILPGTNELAAIVSAIQNSRFTLVVVTDNFVTEMDNQFKEAPMIEHALQMALMDEYYTKRQTLHLMLCTSAERVKYPPYILKILRDQRVTSFPSDDEQGVTISMINTFWDHMSLTIGRAEQGDGEDLGWSFNTYYNAEVN